MSSTSTNAFPAKVFEGSAIYMITPSRRNVAVLRRGSVTVSHLQVNLPRSYVLLSCHCVRGIIVALTPSLGVTIVVKLETQSAYVLA